MPKLIKNAGFLLIGQLAVVCTALVTLAFTARYLGVGRFGEQAVLRATAVFVTPLLAGGLRLHVTRHLGQDRASTAPFYFGTAQVLSWVLALTVGLVGCAVVWMLPLSGLHKLSGYAAVVLIASGVWDAVPAAVFTAYEMNQFNMVMSAANGLLALLFTLVIIRVDGGVPGILLASAAPNILCAQAGFFYISCRLLRPRLSFNPREWWRILSGSAYLSVSGVLQRAYTQVDVWLLAALRSAVAAGTFSVAYRATIQVQTTSIILSTVLLPRLAWLAKESVDDLRIAFERLMLVLLTVSVGAAGLVAVAAEPLVLAIVGPRFAASAGALRLLSVALVTSLPSATLFFVLVSLGKDAVAVGALAITVTANVLLDALLIPHLGVTGACIGTLVAEWVFLTYSLFQVHRALRLTSIWQFVGKPIAAGLPMLLAICLLGPGRPLAAGVTAFAAYFASLLLLRALPSGVIRELRRSLAVPSVEPTAAPALAGVME